MKNKQLWLLLPILGLSAMFFLPSEWADKPFKSSIYNGSLLVWVGLILHSALNHYLYNLKPTLVDASFGQAYKANLLSFRLVALGWVCIALAFLGLPAYYSLFSVLGYLAYCALDTFLSSWADRNKIVYIIYGLIAIFMVLVLPTLLAKFGFYQDYSIEGMPFAALISGLLVAFSYLAYGLISSLPTKRAQIAELCHKYHFSWFKMEV